MFVKSADIDLGLLGDTAGVLWSPNIVFLCFNKHWSRRKVILAYQTWTRSSENITLSRVQVRGFEVTTKLPRCRHSFPVRTQSLLCVSTSVFRSICFTSKFLLFFSCERNTFFDSHGHFVFPPKSVRVVLPAPTPYTPVLLLQTCGGVMLLPMYIYKMLLLVCCCTLLLVVLAASTVLLPYYCSCLCCVRIGWDALIAT